MNQEIITIKASHYEQGLASGVAGEHVQLFEGAWYFARDRVDMTHLIVTDRTYICPYKGVCYWIDLDMGDRQAQNVAFTYFDVNPGYEFIQDKIAFYAGRREATYEESVAVVAADETSNAW